MHFSLTAQALVLPLWVMKSNPFTRQTDLDVDAPEKVSKVLRDAAQMYYESASELQSAWQDKSAGKIWNHLAIILEQAADKVDKAA